MADIMVVVGTSLSVAPASGLVKYAHKEVPNRQSGAMSRNELLALLDPFIG